MDLDHPDAPKLVNSILAALEALTREASMTRRDGTAPQNATETGNGADDGAQPQARDETMRDSVPQDTSVPEVGPSLLDSTEIVRQEQMEHDDGFERDAAEEVHVMLVVVHSQRFYLDLSCAEF